VIGWEIARGILDLCLALLVCRLVFDWVFVFAREYRPTGFLAAALEVVYSITDPPLRALRRVIPPLRLGSVALDLAFVILFAGILVVIQLLPA
jgi:YggT family protein